MTICDQVDSPPAHQEVHHLAEEAHREGDGETAGVSQWGGDDVVARLPPPQGHHAGVHAGPGGETPLSHFS